MSETADLKVQKGSGTQSSLSKSLPAGRLMDDSTHRSTLAPDYSLQQLGSGAFYSLKTRLGRGSFDQHIGMDFSQKIGPVLTYDGESKKQVKAVNGRMQETFCNGC